MRLYLNAKSKNNIGYTPDWLKVNYEEKGKKYELVLDIQGTIDYSKDCLSCRCKGELIPWTLWDLETGQEINLDTILTERAERVNIYFPDEKIAEIVCNSEFYEVGVYPIDDNEENDLLVKNDTLTDCTGDFEMFVAGNHYSKYDFNFSVEINY